MPSEKAANDVFCLFAFPLPSSTACTSARAQKMRCSSSADGPSRLPAASRVPVPEQLLADDSTAHLAAAIETATTASWRLAGLRSLRM